jgi:hypothetical protein
MLIRQDQTRRCCTRFKVVFRFSYCGPLVGRCENHVTIPYVLFSFGPRWCLRRMADNFTRDPRFKQLVGGLYVSDCCVHRAIARNRVELRPAI